MPPASLRLPGLLTLSILLGATLTAQAPAPTGPADSTSAFLGVAAGPLARTGSDGRVAEGGAGAVIEKVAPGGPADRAGLRAGDVVVGADARNISRLSELAEVVRGHRPGDVLQLVVVRNGQTGLVRVHLTQRPD